MALCDNKDLSTSNNNNYHNHTLIENREDCFCHPVPFQEMYYESITLIIHIIMIIVKRVF